MRASRVVVSNGRSDTALTLKRVSFIHKHAGTLSSKEMAEELGVPAHTIRTLAANHAISLKLNPPILEEDCALIRQLQMDGMPDEEIAEKWECSVPTLHRYMRRYKVKRWQSA